MRSNCRTRSECCVCLLCVFVECQSSTYHRKSRQKMFPFLIRRFSFCYFCIISFNWLILLYFCLLFVDTYSGRKVEKKWRKEKIRKRKMFFMTFHLLFRCLSFISRFCYERDWHVVELILFWKHEFTKLRNFFMNCNPPTKLVLSLFCVC